MGNHTTPYDDLMAQQSYTVAENWGGQINFMIPLDREGLKRCRSIAAQQEAKMKLDYELVRMKNCAELQQKGFMLIPGSRVYHICSDVIPIAAWKEAEKKILQCTTPPTPWYKPWAKPKPKCKMSTLTKQRGEPEPDLSDKVPAVKTSFILSQEAAPKTTKKTKKSE